MRSTVKVLPQSLDQSAYRGPREVNGRFASQICVFVLYSPRLDPPEGLIGPTRAWEGAKLATPVRRPGICTLGCVV